MTVRMAAAARVLHSSVQTFGCLSVRSGQTNHAVAHPKILLQKSTAKCHCFSMYILSNLTQPKMLKDEQFLKFLYQLPTFTPLLLVTKNCFN